MPLNVLAAEVGESSDRSSDTDSIFRLYRTIQSFDVMFRFLYRPIVSVRFKFPFFNQPILFLGLKLQLLYLARSVLSSDSLINRSCFLILCSDFCIVRLCRPVLSKKSLHRYFIKIKNRLKIAAAGQI